MPAAAPDNNQWYYARDDEQFGPVTQARLKKLANAGELHPDDLVWCEGMDQWVRARKLKGLIPNAAGERRSAAFPQRKARPSLQDTAAAKAGQATAPQRTTARPPDASGADEGPDVFDIKENKAAADDEGIDPGVFAGLDDDQPAAFGASPEHTSPGDTLFEVDEWFYAQEDDEHGPVTLDKLREMLTSGALAADDLVWSEQLEEWTPAGEVEPLAESALVEPPVQAPAAATKKPTKTKPGPGRPPESLEVSLASTPLSQAQAGRLSRDEWYYAEGEEQKGPVTRDQLQSLADDGELPPDALIWRLGLEDWFPAEQLEGLFPDAGMPGAPPVQVATGSGQAADLRLADGQSAQQLVRQMMQAPVGTEIRFAYLSADGKRHEKTIRLEPVDGPGSLQELAERIGKLEKEMAKLASGGK